MDGKWVTLDLGKMVKCEVFVPCLEHVEDEEMLHRLAMNKLRSCLPSENQSSFAKGMEAIHIISDYEYAQGRGVRYELEQEFKKHLQEYEEK